MTAVTPWWDMVELRDEIVSADGEVGDVQMSLFRTVHGTLGDRPPYADPAYFGEITHPSPSLVNFMGMMAARLGGGSAARNFDALVRLDQGLGGGKSHGLIGLYHLACDPQAMSHTEVGARALEEAAAKLGGRELPEDLGEPQVVVLACDNMTAGTPDANFDGPAENLYQRFLWRLVDGDKALFQRYKDQHASKDGIAQALIAVNRPVLILVDEILDYVRQLSTSANADLAVEDMAFLRALCDVVDDVDGVAMVVVMIASERDSTYLDADGEKRRAELEDLLTRNGTTETVTSNADFADILHRRLFKKPAPREVVDATAEQHLAAMDGAWRDKVFDGLPGCGTQDFPGEVTRCYPFHPLLIHMAEGEWSRIAGFQRVRSTIRVFAATVYDHRRRAQTGGWAPTLIGAGDVPLSDPTVREAVIGSGLIADQRAAANYRALAAADIVAEDDRHGAARQLDLSDSRIQAPYYAANPRPAERAATALFLHSIIGGRAQGHRGATKAELKAAMFVPDAAFTHPDADTVLAELADPQHGLATREEIPGRGGQPARWFLTTRQTLNMHYRAERQAVTDDERDEQFARVAERLATQGPFKQTRFVEATAADDPREALATAGLDEARTTRLVVLDPRVFSFLNGIDADTRAALEAAFGLGDRRLSVAWAASMVFAIVNTQRRAQARAAVADWMAWDRTCSREEVRTDDDVLAEAKEKRREADRRMKQTVKQAYQHIAYLDEALDQGREMRNRRLEQDNEAALDGAVVWAHLVDADRALGADQFDATVLIHNLRDDDYQRPLDELRDLFWQMPRLPLLPDGEGDLKMAIYQAIRDGRLCLVGDDGEERSVTAPAQLALGQRDVYLRPPRPSEPQPAGDDAGEDRAAGAKGQGSAGTTHAPHTAASTGPSDALGPATGQRTEEQVSLNITKNLKDPDTASAVYDLLGTLADAADRDASYFQASVRAVVSTETAEALQHAAEQLGITLNRHQM